MGATRKAAQKGKAGGNGRGPATRRGSGGARPDADLSASERSRSDPDGASLADGGLASVDQTIDQRSRYQRLRLKAEAALEILVASPGTPAAVRAASARTLLELTGAIGKNKQDQQDSTSDLDPESLTIEGIDAEILRLDEV